MDMGIWCRLDIGRVTRIMEHRTACHKITSMTMNDATSCKKPCTQVTIAATLKSRHQSWTQIRRQQRCYKHIVSSHWICTLNRTKSRRQAWKTIHASKPKTYRKKQNVRSIHLPLPDFGTRHHPKTIVIRSDCNQNSKWQARMKKKGREKRNQHQKQLRCNFHPDFGGDNKKGDKQDVR